MGKEVYEDSVEVVVGQGDGEGNCAYCGAPAEGNYSVHRDGFCKGPEVPLCDACGGSPTPTLAEIWDRIARTWR